MNPTPEIIEAVITGLIIGLGMVIYRVYQHQFQGEDDTSTQTPTSPTNGNGFRVAMESVREAYGTNVELLHEQIYDLEKELARKEDIIQRLNNLLLSKGILVDGDGHVLGNAQP